ncbi:MAG: PucR family transcriptional regulator [Zhaonellaceae bacterium]|jgi:purine catabolism regulator
MAGISLLQFLKNTNMIGTSVIAGWGGLGRKINSIAVIETPIATKWLKGNELILTTGYFLNGNDDSFLEFIARLAERGASALALAPQSYLGTIPSEVVDMANQLLFPIISMPSSMTFWDLSRFFIKLSETNEAENSVEESPSLVEENYGPIDLLDYMAGKLDGVILLQEKDFEPVMIFCQDQKIISSILLKRKKNNIKDQVLAESRYEYKYACSIGETNLRWCEQVYPIISKGKIAAYLSFIVQEDKADLVKDKSLDNMVEYIMLSHQDVEKVIQVMKRKKRFIFYEALLKEIPTNFAEYARIEPVLNRPGRIVAVKMSGIDEQSDLFNKAIDLVEFRSQARDAEALVANINNNIIVLLHSDRFSLMDIRKFITETQISLVELGVDRVKWGIGTEASDVNEYKTSYCHALQALFTAGFEDDNSNVRFYHDLGIYQLIKDGSTFKFFRDYAKEYLKPILTLECSRQRELFACLDAFFDENCSYSLAAKKLYLHENTVRYRIQKVEEYLAIDLKKTEDKFLLFFAIKTLDLAKKLTL